MTDYKPRRRCAVYRYYDGCGKLLYVGSSMSPASRWSGHKRTAGWFDLVVKMKVKWFDSIDAARRAETFAIVREKPVNNKYRPRRLPRPKPKQEEPWGSGGLY